MHSLSYLSSAMFEAHRLKVVRRLPTRLENGRKLIEAQIKMTDKGEVLFNYDHMNKVKFKS